EFRSFPTTRLRKLAADLNRMDRLFYGCSLILPTDYFWTLHLNISLSRGQRGAIERHKFEFEDIATRVALPNVPFSRLEKLDDLSIETDIKGERKCDVARLEYKGACIGPGSSVKYWMLFCRYLYALAALPESDRKVENDALGAAYAAHSHPGPGV